MDLQWHNDTQHRDTSTHLYPPTQYTTHARTHARMYTHCKEGSTLVHHTTHMHTLSLDMQCMYYSMTAHTGSQSHECTWPPPTQHQQQLHTWVVSKWWITVHISYTYICTYTCTYVHTWTHNAQLYDCSHVSTTTNSITTATRESRVQVVNTCTALYLGTPSKCHTCTHASIARWFWLVLSITVCSYN